MSAYASTGYSPVTTKEDSSTFAQIRAASSAKSKSTFQGVDSSSGYVDDDSANLAKKLNKLGLGGGIGIIDTDNSKFRRDKPSRLFRLQRGTKCFRFTLLFLSVIIVFSGYFQFDLPAITVNKLLPKLNIGMEQYSTIFVGYSVSNTIVPLLSGPFFGRVGKWRGVVIIASVITVGIAIVYAGILANSYPVVVFGRSVYGIGGESVFVGIDILVTKWFAGAEIGFAYGLIQAAGQAGSFTALYTVPPLVEWMNGEIDNIYLTSFLLSCFALCLLGLARLLEKTAYGTKRALEKVVVGEGGGMHHDAGLSRTGAGGFAAAVMDDSTLGGSKKGKHGKEETARLLDADHGASEGDDKGGAHAEDDEDAPEEADTDTVSDELRMRMERNLAFVRCIPPLYNLLMFLGIGHMISLSWRFYAVLGGIICYSSAFYTFLAFGPKWLMNTYAMSEGEAGQTAGIIAIFSMIVSPSIGLVMDKRGGQRYVCFGAMLSACFWFGIMGYTHAPPAMCIVFAGMSYSLLPASLYPLLPEFVPDESFTIVYAILNSLINLVFTIVLLIAGQLLGAGDVNSLAATCRVCALTRLGGGGLGNGGETEGNVDPKGFEYVFAMFITITGAGTLITGSLAWDGYKTGSGWVPLTNKH